MAFIGDEFLESLTSAQNVKLYDTVRAAYHLPASHSVSHRHRQGYVLSHGIEKVREELADCDPTSKKYPADFSFDEKHAIEKQARRDIWGQPYGVERHLEASYRVAADPKRVAEAVANLEANKAVAGSGF